jgi:hypothetical protein
MVNNERLRHVWLWGSGIYTDFHYIIDTSRSGGMGGKKIRHPSYGVSVPVRIMQGFCQARN